MMKMNTRSNLAGFLSGSWSWFESKAFSESWSGRESKQDIFDEIKFNWSKKKSRIRKIVKEYSENTTSHY